MNYFDNAALEKPKNDILKYVSTILENNWYNPNSIYDAGAKSKQLERV